VTGWVALALLAARKAGAQVPDHTLSNCGDWFRRSVSADGAVDYVGRRTGTTALLGAGYAVSVYLGRPGSDPALRAVAKRLRAAPPIWNRSAEKGRDVFGPTDPSHWYYGSLAAFQAGGGTWRAWDTRLRDLLLRSQERDGHAIGSWAPRGKTGHQGGRVVMTALAALCLEVSYRYPRVSGSR
jgi:hypothetical protein